MKLSEREKFVVHFMAASIYGIHENASDHAIDCAIRELTKVRCENLSFDDISYNFVLYNYSYCILGSS